MILDSWENFGKFSLCPLDVKKLQKFRATITPWNTDNSPLQYLITILIRKYSWSTSYSRLLVRCHDFRFLGEFWQILSVSFRCEETSEVQSYHNTMKYWQFPFTVSHHNIKRVNSSLCLTPIVQMSLRSGSSDPHFCGHSLLVISTTSLANASLMWNGSSGREPLPWYKTHKLTWENGNLRTIKFTLHLNCIQAWFEL